MIRTPIDNKTVYWFFTRSCLSLLFLHSLLPLPALGQTDRNIMGVCRSSHLTVGGLDTFEACADLYDKGYELKWLYLRYGQLLEERNKIELAREVYTKGLERFPGYAKLVTRIDNLGPGDAGIDADAAAQVESTDAVRGAISIATALPEQPIEYGTYHALVIGNNNYRHLTVLKTAVNDARTIAALLQEQYGFKVTLLENATRSDIIFQLARLRRDLLATDNLLIYYAGHGSVDADTGRGYWLPVDAEKGNPTNWIANDDITTQLKAMLAKHVLVVADSCYSATLTRSTDLNLRTGGTDEWIKRMVRRRSRTVLTSGGLEPVVDSGGNNHSVFANAFIDALRNNESAIDMVALFEPIKRHVVLRARQTPVYSDIRFTDHDDGDFIFTPR